MKIPIDTPGENRESEEFFEERGKMLERQMAEPPAPEIQIPVAQSVQQPIEFESLEDVIDFIRQNSRVT